MKKRSYDLSGGLTGQRSKTCPSDLTHQNRYNEKAVEYSANGMMKRFQRRGLKSDGIYGKVDNLHITLDGNRPGPSRWDKYLGMTAAMTHVSVPSYGLIRKMLVSLCAIIAFANCHNKRTTEQIGNINDSIIVSYYPYMFESTERVTCSSMAEETAKIPVDSIVYLQMEDFNEIKAFVTMPHVIRDTIGCDSRMYVRYNKKVVCIGNISSCLCDMDGNKLESNSKIVYMIKWRAGYFNCFSEHELEFDETIGMFGIPIDYTYATERETDENSIKKLRLRKIAFLPCSKRGV